MKSMYSQTVFALLASITLVRSAAVFKSPAVGDVTAVDAESCKHTDKCTAWYSCLCPDQCSQTLQCQVCGYQGSSPYDCIAYNATYDKLTVGSTVTNYDYSSLSPSFVVETTSGKPKNKIAPISKKNYVRSLTGKGELTFTYPDTAGGSSGELADLGSLYSFAYGCADPSTLAPVPCNVTVIAGCLLSDNQDDEVTTYYTNTTYQYTGASTTMVNAAWTPAGNGYDYSSNQYYQYIPFFCGNFTFEAVGSTGKPVALYLDNVVYNVWQESDA